MTTMEQLHDIALYSPLTQLVAMLGFAVLAGGCSFVLGYAHGKEVGRAEARTRCAKEWAT